MKKYILSLVAILTLVSGNALATQDEGAAGANTKREIAGALGYVPYKELQLVRWAENGPNPTGGNLSAGDVVVWDCVSDDGVTIAIVGATNSVDAVAGVVVSTRIQSVDSTGTTPGIDYGRRNWGYMQVRGQITTINMFGGPAAGGNITAAAQVRCATAAPAGNTNKVMGFAYDASGAGSANDAMISL